MQTLLDRRETGSWADAPEDHGNEWSLKNESRPSGMPLKPSAPFIAEKPFPVIGKRNNEGNALVEAMINSRIYQDYEKAFSDATGLPVTLRPMEDWQMPEKCQTAVPVRLGERLIGFLQAGSVEADGDQLDETFFQTAIVSNKQHDAVVKLLAIFAQHLSMLSNQVVVRRENSEPPTITRAKNYIQEHLTEDLSLGQVAKAVNTSTFYFCKMFKKATGINFTDYLSRMRIEKSKNLLLNPNLRVSEIAFEAGFQSLTHFNRVFKKLLGQSPTEYRAEVLG
jgi:YesN/AraC family two-component response regulator